MTKRFIPRRCFLFIGLGIVFVLGGCASSPASRFYTLSPLREEGKGVKESPFDQSLTIVVGPIQLPEYLDRTEIVTRAGRNKIIVSDFDLWAGSLAEGFSRVLAENLSALLFTENVMVYPGLRSRSARYQLTAEVIRFDGSLGGDISLIAHWTIFEGKERKVVFAHKSAIIEPSGEKGYEALVAASSRALEKLSREIADVIKALAKSN